MATSCLSLRAGCAQSLSQIGSHPVCLAMSCPSLALDVSVSPGGSLFILSIPGMEWGSGKGGELSTLTVNKSHGGEGMQRQSSPESDSSHHPRPPWPCCPVLDDAGPPEGQAFHPTGQDLTGGRDTAGHTGRGDGQGGFPGEMCLGANT